MDVLVKWKDKSVNCVSTRELKTVGKNAEFNVGAPVKMMYNGKWYYGTIIETEKECQWETSSSEDNEPLSKLANRFTKISNGVEVSKENNHFQLQSSSEVVAKENGSLRKENELNGNNGHLSNFVSPKKIQLLFLFKVIQLVTPKILFRQKMSTL